MDWGHDRIEFDRRKNGKTWLTVMELGRDETQLFFFFMKMMNGEGNPLVGID